MKNNQKEFYLRIINSTYFSLLNKSLPNKWYYIYLLHILLYIF
jgi:hypothetical protein